MKLKNNVLNIAIPTLITIGNRTNDIKIKWEFNKRLSPFLDAHEFLMRNVNEIINEEGEDGHLSPTNKHYQELMECDIEVDAEFFTLDELSVFNPSIEQLYALQELIKEG